MDARLVRLYEDELAHLKDLGREFAKEHAKARYLDLDSLEVADPYVERLLEGFAFMAARVRLKLEAEQPRLVEQMIQALHPDFLAPMPAAMVAQLHVDVDDPKLARGPVVPRDSAIRSTVRRGADTQCEFRTAMDVQVWPVELVDVRCFTQAPDLLLARLPQTRAAKGGLRLRLRVGGGLRWKNLADCTQLRFYVSAEDEVAYRLHELMLGEALGTLIPEPDQAPRAEHWAGPDSIRPVGFGPAEAMLPERAREYSTLRLIQEAAALPQRLMFFEIGDLARRIERLDREEIELVILLSQDVAELVPVIDATSLALHCTPALNLFPKRLDLVTLGAESSEFHLVPDRVRSMDFEVHSISRVVAHGTDGAQRLREFRPLYEQSHMGMTGGHAYFTVRRERRRLSEQERRQGARVPSYLGDEVFLSLVDGQHGAYREGLRQMSVEALVTNRDLPLLLPRGDNWHLDAPVALKGVSCLRGPSRPYSRRGDGDLGWQLLAQLTQNHLVPGDAPESAAAALRASLRLYGPNHEQWLRQVEGIRQLHVDTVVRRLPGKGPICFGTGISFSLEVDEAAFQGGSAFLLGSLLENHFAHHAAINSFSQFTLSSVQRGEIKAWAPRPGRRLIA
ncbi:MAG: type VI secretion system baseplate subunit TssF [Rubrivivax sp.]|nr:MAG: type VI secretion system baseplate subunit TssF [Rubrivivax sp.]